MQQDLARPGVLDQFLDNPDDIADIQSCFAGIATAGGSVCRPQSVSYIGPIICMTYVSWLNACRYGQKLRAAHPPLHLS